MKIHYLEIYQLDCRDNIDTDLYYLYMTCEIHVIKYFCQITKKCDDDYAVFMSHLFIAIFQDSVVIFLFR